MDQYPTGIWLPEAEARLAELNGGSGRAGRPDPVTEEAALGLTRNDRLPIAQRLNYLGYPPGTQDEFFDSSTRWAIEGYQRSRSLEPTGYLNQTVVSQILKLSLIHI